MELSPPVIFSYITIGFVFGGYVLKKNDSTDGRVLHTLHLLLFAQTLQKNCSFHIEVGSETECRTYFKYITKILYQPHYCCVSKLLVKQINFSNYL